MPTYTYRAIDGRTGREQRGRVEGPNPDQAILKLKTQQLFPFQIDAEPATALETGVRRRGWMRGVRREERLHLTRQLAALLRAGVPLVRALELIARQDHRPDWRAVVLALAESIRAGRSFSESLRREPRIFDLRFVSIVKAGEVAGRLDQCLDRLAGLQEKSERLCRRVQAASVYPAVVGTVAAGIVTALMVFVVPRFESVFAGLLRGEALPLLTRSVIAIARFMQEHFLGLGLAVTGFSVALTSILRTPRGRRFWDDTMLRVPLLGDLCLKASIARFSRTLGVLLTSGVPILSALEIAGTTAGNERVAAILQVARGRVEAGEPLSRPLSGSRQFPPLLIGLLEVGEESGGLPEMLQQVADIYDAEVDRAVDAVTAVLEPVLIVFMAAAVGTVVVALFLPIVKIIQSLG